MSEKAEPPKCPPPYSEHDPLADSTAPPPSGYGQPYPNQGQPYPNQGQPYPNQGPPQAGQNLAQPYPAQQAYSNNSKTISNLQKLCELMSQNFVNISFLMSQNPE